MIAAKPKIITLCGSTRFSREMLKEAWRLTIAGNIVIHWNVLFSQEEFSHGAERDGVKETIDALYLHKIAMADEVRVINVDGYIGDSTRAELRHAQKLGKPLTWMEANKVDEEFRDQEVYGVCMDCNTPIPQGFYACKGSGSHRTVR